jgi:hypothetical protein
MEEAALWDVLPLLVRRKNAHLDPHLREAAA